MKLRRYMTILVLAAFTFTACDDDYSEPIVSPSVGIAYLQGGSPNEISVTFTPSRSVVSFTYAMGQDNDRQAFIDGTLAGIRTAEGAEEITEIFTGLRPYTTYTIFAVATGTDGSAGPLAMIKVQTREQNVDISLSTQFIAEKSAAFNISSGPMYYKYEFALGRPGDRVAFDRGVLDGIRERTEMMSYTATYFELDLDSDYVFYLRAYDRSTERPTEIIEFPFRTAAKGTVPAVSIELQHIDIFSGDYLITPNPLCGQFGICAGLGGTWEEVYENETNMGDAFRMLHRWFDAGSGYVTRGYQSFVYQYYNAGMLLGTIDAFNHPIELYIIVYDNADNPVNVQKFVYYTPSYDDSMGEAEVSINVTDIHDHGAMYEFTVNEHTMGLVFETVDEEWYEALLKSGQYYEGYMEDLIFGEGYWNYVHNITKTSFPEGTAQPGRNYRVFYMPMNYNGPYGGLGKMKSFSYTTTGKSN